MAEQTETISVRLPAGTMATLQALAKAETRPIAQMARVLIEEGLKAKKALKS